jgi:hypothetical protein
MKDFLNHEINVGDKVAYCGGESKWLAIGVVKRISKSRVSLYNEIIPEIVKVRFPSQLIVLTEERVL